MTSLRGQGALEYLVAAAIVLVVALASISLLGFFPGTSGDTHVSQSQAYWVSARPTGVYNAKTISTACNGSGSGYSMTLENHELNPIRLTGISIDGSALAFCTSGRAPSSEIRLDTYQKTEIEVPANISSSAGKTVSSNISINYTTYYGIPNVQYGSTPLVITNDLPAASCADEGDSCASLSCCSGGYCYSSVCYTCGGLVHGTCPPGMTCLLCAPATAYSCSLSSSCGGAP